MKKLILILFGFALTISAMAQTAPQKAHMEKKKDEKKLEHAIVAKKEERHELGNDLKHLKVGAAIKERKDVRADKKVIHQRAKHLTKAHGVKHPIHTAKGKLHEKKEEKEAKY